MNPFALFLTTATPQEVDPITSLLTMVVPFGLMFAFLYFFMIRPQRKKDKELRAQINSMIVGDDVVTIGGIIGRVANIKDDEITIQTSVAKTLVTVRKSAISQVLKKISDE